MYQNRTGGDRPTPPWQLINASRFMYAGAAIQAIVLIIDLATIGSLKSVDRHLAISQFNADVGRDVLFDLLVVGLWVWMGWASWRGRYWVRIAATVLFGLDTLLLIRFLFQPSALNFNVVVEVLTWLVGLGAIILVWNGKSTAFHRAQQGKLKT
jgi:hypothetical protein